MLKRSSNMVNKQNNVYLFQCISCFEVLLMVLVLLLFVSIHSCVSESNHHRCSVKENGLKNFANFKCFPVKFADFFRTPIFKNICEWLLLLFWVEKLWCLVNTRERTLISLLLESDFSVEIEIIKLYFRICRLEIKRQSTKYFPTFCA